MDVFVQVFKIPTRFALEIIITISLSNKSKHSHMCFAMHMYFYELLVTQ